MDLSNPFSALQAIPERFSESIESEYLDICRSLLKRIVECETENVFEDTVKLIDSDHWQLQAAGLMVAALFEKRAIGQDGSEQEQEIARVVVNDENTDALVSRAMDLLANQEPRVRRTVVSMLEYISQRNGTKAFIALKPAIYKNIFDNFERDGTEVYAVLVPDADKTTADGPSTDDDDVSSTASAAIPIIAHDTVGWKALESSIGALTGMIRGCGPAFVTEGHLDDDIRRNILPRASDHINRFVREAAYFLLNAVVEVCSVEYLLESGFDADAATLAAKGLHDNWSQVRFAASVATRALMTKSDVLLSKFAALMIPRMALNRYYVAEGVKLYSQETWRLVTKGNGPALVSQVVDSVVEEYVLQADADNHAVREAACHCIAELAHKVDQTVVSPHVPTLLKVLVDCFMDESWPVRDAACLASGRFVEVFPKESEGSLAELYKLWFDHLWDNIWSVREDSAVSLGRVMTAYGLPAVERCVAVCKERLPKARDQPTDSKKFGDLSNVTTYGVAKRLRDNDVEAHTGNQVYSCGSLAPKLRKGGGCMDHGFKRAQQVWEGSDGAVYLLRELAEFGGEEKRSGPRRGLSAGLAMIRGEMAGAKPVADAAKADTAAEAAPAPEAEAKADAAGEDAEGHQNLTAEELSAAQAAARKGVMELLPMLADIASVQHFTHAVQLQETIWKQLPIIMKAAGKVVLKRTLELFLEPLIAQLESPSRLTQFAAEQCVAELRDMMGERIFMGRLNDTQRNAVVTNKNIPKPGEARHISEDAGSDFAAHTGQAVGHAVDLRVSGLGHRPDVHTPRPGVELAAGTIGAARSPVRHTHHTS